MAHQPKRGSKRYFTVRAIRSRTGDLDDWVGGEDIDRIFRPRDDS